MAFERYVYHYMRRFCGNFAPLHVFAFYQKIDRKLPIKSFKIMMENIPMTYGAKRLLILETNRLSGTELSEIVKIVTQRALLKYPNNPGDEVVVDFEKLKPSTLARFSIL